MTVPPVDVPASAPRAGTTATPATGASAADDRIRDFGLFLETHARLTRELDRCLREAHGLPLAWLEVLIRLSRAPEGHTSMGQLAEQSVLTSGGVTRLSDRLVQAGLIRRVPCAEDRRVTFLALTDEGARVLDQALPSHVADLDRLLFDSIGDEERALWRGIFERLR